MVTITNRELRHTVWETFYDDLKAFATAGSYGTSVQPTVVSAFIDDNPTFPMIVIHPVSVREGKRTFDNSSSLKNISLVFDVYAKKSEDIETLGDDVAYVLADKVAGITLVDVEEAFAVPIVNDTKIKNKTISYNYIRR